MIIIIMIWCPFHLFSSSILIARFARYLPPLPYPPSPMFEIIVDLLYPAIAPVKVDESTIKYNRPQQLN